MSVISTVNSLVAPLLASMGSQETLDEVVVGSDSEPTPLTSVSVYLESGFHSLRIELFNSEHDDSPFSVEYSGPDTQEEHRPLKGYYSFKDARYPCSCGFIAQRGKLTDSGAVTGDIYVTAATSARWRVSPIARAALTPAMSTSSRAACTRTQACLLPIRTGPCCALATLPAQ